MALYQRLEVDLKKEITVWIGDYAKDGGPRGSDLYVVFTVILRDANFYVP